MLYFILVLIFFLIEFIYFRIAKKYNILDVPNERSAHQNTTIRGIGMVFLVAVLGYFVLSKFQYPYFIVGVLLIGGISFLDDIKPLPNRYRILVQFISVGLLFVEVSQKYDIPPIWLLVPLVIVSVGIINAYNFMDGINGITGAYSLLAIGTLAYINTSIIPFIDEQFLIIISLSILVFLFFNFRTRAVGFCGDVGSVSMAFIVMFCLFSLVFTTNNWKYIFLLTAYGIDTIYTLIYRLTKRENIFKAHKLHFFQLLVHEYGWSHLGVSTLFVAVQLVINAFVIYYELTDWQFYIPMIITLFTVHYFRFNKGVAIG